MAPITEPIPIGVIVLRKSVRSANALRLAYLITPTSTVGKLTIRLAVPAVLISAPKAKTSVGIITSPPATPSKLLTSPIAKPNKIPAGIRQLKAGGKKLVFVEVENPQLLGQHQSLLITLI